jgi:hypothetical protein
MPELKRNPDGTLDEYSFNPDFSFERCWRALRASVVACAARDYYFGKQALEKSKERCRITEKDYKDYRETMDPGDPVQKKKLTKLEKRRDAAYTQYGNIQDRISSTVSFFRSEALQIYTDIPGDFMLEKLDQMVKEKKKIQDNPRLRLKEGIRNE